MKMHEIIMKEAKIIDETLVPLKEIKHENYLPFTHSNEEACDTPPLPLPIGR